MTTETDTTYNGWKNYETWSVALIADNDEGLYLERKEIVAQAIEEAQDCRQVVEGIWTQDEATRYKIADAIEDWVSNWYEIEQLEESEGNYLVKQLFSAAFHDVDWNEIAENWMSE